MRTEGEALHSVLADADPMFGAACSLGAEERRARTAAWRAVRDDALAIETVDDAIRLRLPLDYPIAEVARLVGLESECCPFFRFTIAVDGTVRVLDVDAGPGRLPAVSALLGLPG
jgi:MerR family copper efflux transcriptional regulator